MEKLYNMELIDFCCRPNTVKVIKSRRLRWVGNVARMEDNRDQELILAMYVIRQLLVLGNKGGIRIRRLHKNRSYPTI